MKCSLLNFMGIEDGSIGNIEKFIRESKAVYDWYQMKINAAEHTATHTSRSHEPASHKNEEIRTPKFGFHDSLNELSEILRNFFSGASNKLRKAQRARNTKIITKLNELVDIIIEIVTKSEMREPLSNETFTIILNYVKLMIMTSSIVPHLEETD